jgi:uncharacterized protein YqhQ
MSYQIGFHGAASAELSQMLHAVERQLNWHGAHVRALTNVQAQEAATPPSTATGESTRPCRDHGCDDHPRCGHDVVIIVVVAIVVIVSAGVGFGLGVRYRKIGQN